MKELWLPVRGYEGLYEVSDLGRVRGLKRDQLLRPWNHLGYARFSLCKNGKRHHHLAHRLVIESFIGPAPGAVGTGPFDYVVDHINRQRSDNRPENLQWVTTSQNKAKDGTGSDHSHAKTNETDVLLIRSSCDAVKDIAQKFGLSRQAVTDIRQRRTWKHV